MIGMHHPKHFWMFKYLIKEGMRKGWDFRILVSRKDVLESLLKEEGMDYYIIGKNQPTLFKKGMEMVRYTKRTLKYAREFRPDIFIGQAYPHFSVVSTIRKRPYVIWEDTEHVGILHKITVPFSTAIITPDCFRKDLGKKHIRVNAYLELAYLHPNRFKPDPKILYEKGIDPKEKYAVIRFVSWKAHHDVGESGTPIDIKREIVSTFEKEGFRVFISSENPLEKEFEKYRIELKPQEIHHLLFYATIFMGESGTMATEAAVLGTPSVRTNAFAGESMGNFIELENKYGLLYSFRNPGDALRKVVEFIGNDKIKDKWKKRKERMLQDKIDLTDFNLWFIENYPESMKMAQEGEYNG